MKHNLLSATHHPTLHQCTMYILSSVISGISWKVSTTITGIHPPSNTFSSVWHGWLVLLSQVDWCYSPRYLCACAHNDTAELCYSLTKTIWLGQTTNIQFACKHIYQAVLVHYRAALFSQNYIFVLSMAQFSGATLPNIYLPCTSILTAEVGLQGEQFIGILLAKFKLSYVSAANI